MLGLLAGYLRRPAAAQGAPGRPPADLRSAPRAAVSGPSHV